MFKGSLVALVTPMTAAGLIDEEALSALVERHIHQGTQGIVVNGTTGEGATLTEGERLRVLQVALDAARNRIPIIAGTGSTSTLESIARSEKAFELGAEACLVVTPYYNKPTQEGLYRHFATIAEEVSGPLIMYNVPSRTACDLSTEIVERLSHIPNIVGLKEATGDLAKQRELQIACQNRISFYSGDDASSLAFMCQGGKGVISVTANVAPKAMSEMCKLALEGKVQKAGELNTKLMPLHKALFVESNPIPVKWVLGVLQWIKEGIRLPLLPLSEKYHVMLREAMTIAGVIE